MRFYGVGGPKSGGKNGGGAIGGGEDGIFGGRFLPLCLARYFLIRETIITAKSAIPLHRAIALRLIFGALATSSAGFSVGTTNGAGVYFLRTIVWGVGLTDGFGVDLAATLARVVGVGVGARQPQVKSDGQSGFLQKPLEQNNPELQL